MSKYLLGFSLICSIGFIGCGSSGDDAGVTTSKLKGIWEKQCQNTPANTSLKTVLVFEKDSFTRSSYEYNDIGCKDNNIVKHIDIYYDYVLGKNVDTVDGKKATEIENTVTGFRVTDGTYSNDEIPSAGDKERNIVYIDNKQLYIGEDKVPYSLDYQHYFTKIK